MNGHGRVGDSYTWSIAPDTDGVEAGQPSSVLQHSFFEVAHNNPSESVDTGKYFVHMRAVQSHVLRYEYTTSLKDHDPLAFWPSVEPKLVELTNAELSKIPEHERSILFEVMFRKYEHAYWSFYDDQIPVWYEPYRQEVERLKTEKDMAREEPGETENSSRDDGVGETENIRRDTSEIAFGVRPLFLMSRKAIF